MSDLLITGASLLGGESTDVLVRAGVIAETPGPGEYTRPAETGAPAEGH